MSHYVDVDNEKELEPITQEAIVAALNVILKDGKNKNGIVYDGGNEILCKKEYQAEGIADFLEDMGFEDVRTGYYDPVEDERNGEVDRYTGLYYVDWD